MALCLIPTKYHQLFFILNSFKDSNATQICAGLYIKKKRKFRTKFFLRVCMCLFLRAVNEKTVFSHRCSILVLFFCLSFFFLVNVIGCHFISGRIYTGQTFLTCISLSFFGSSPVTRTIFMSPSLKG